MEVQMLSSNLPVDLNGVRVGKVVDVRDGQLIMQFDSVDLAKRAMDLHRQSAVSLGSRVDKRGRL